MTSLLEVRVPDIGDFKDVAVIEVLVQVGERIDKDAPLIVLETDKATMEVPSNTAGVVRELSTKVGDRISQGDLILLVDKEGDTVTVTQASGPPVVRPETETKTKTVGEAALTAAPIAAQPAPVPTQRLPVSGVSGHSEAAAVPVRPASPLLRKLARELGVDLAQVTPTGDRGRLQRVDVERFVRDELSRAASSTTTSQASAGLGLLPWPQIDFSRFGTIERRPLSRLRKISGKNLARNWVMIPHVTNYDEADITELEAFRLQVNREQTPDEFKLTMLAFLIKASIEVLRRYPEYNASLDGEELILKRYFHIGFAADTPNGLVVPVIRDADQKSVREIAREAAVLAAVARAGKLRSEQMQGGCFTVSSLGGIGGTGFTPIINAPEVAILGVTRAELKPKWDGSQFKPRLMLPLNLSWDHRVVDGASAARFLVALCSLLADFRRVVL